MGFNVGNVITLKMAQIHSPSNFNSSNAALIDYDQFKKSQGSHFKLFNNLHNITYLRVYPHKIFCNTLVPGKCISHDAKFVYYRDDHHLSYQGARIVSKFIFDAISLLENYNGKG